MTFLTENAPELRAAPRHAVQIPLAAHLLEHDLALQARDVSRGGLFIESPHAPPLGHALHVSLRLDGVHALEAVATVVRSEPGRGFAVRLSVAGREGRLQWARYLASLQHAGAAGADATSPPWPRTLDPHQVFDFTWVNEAHDAP